MQEFPTPVPVVAAALLRDDRTVLMQQRRIGGAHGGLWEFPGGKVEPRETPENALIRELEEELGIAVAPSQLVPLHYAAAPGEPVVILLYTCRVWQGEPRCLVGEEIAWFDVIGLDRLDMPPLDVPLAKALQRFI